MKEQTTCNASYMNISLMFVLFAEKSFFFLFSPFFLQMRAHPSSAQAWIWNAKLPQESLSIAIYFQPSQQLKVS